MAFKSKRYISAFDDECVENEECESVCDEICTAFESDSEDEEFEPVYKPIKADNFEIASSKRYQERRNALVAMYEKPLAECYDVIKDKLTWAENFNPNPTILPVKKRESSPGKQQSVKLVPSTKFGKAEPMDIGYSFNQPSGLKFRQPKREIVKIDKLCMYVAKQQQCPYGEDCRFLHKMAAKPRAQQNGLNQSKDQQPVDERSKKIWLCKNLVQNGSCKFGDGCKFAHTYPEIKAAVKDCTHGVNCRAVKKDGLRYLNDGPRKCVRLHPRERIADFVARTR